MRRKAPFSPAATIIRRGTQGPSSGTALVRLRRCGLGKGVFLSSLVWKEREAARHRKSCQCKLVAGIVSSPASPCRDFRVRSAEYSIRKRRRGDWISFPKWDGW